MAFERFTKNGRSYRSRLSIRSNGQVGFSQGAIHKFKLAEFKYGVLFYDKDGKKVGVRLTNDENEDGISKLQVRPENASISAKAFLDYYEINYGETKNYPIVWDDENQMIVADLNSSE